MTSIVPKIAALLAVAIVAASAAPADALDFHVTPLVVHIRAGTNAQTITLQNTSTAPLRIHVAAFLWSQEGSAPEKLEPTDDVIFFPSLLTILPSESRAVRVGLMKPGTGAVERTYRVMLQELPALETALAPNTASIAVRLQLSIPVYAEPARPSAKPDVDGASVRGGKLSFRLFNNGGNTHFKVLKLAVSGVDNRGSSILSEELQSPVILANGSHTFDVALDPAKCGKLHEVTISAQTDGGNVKRTVPASPDLCR